MRQKQHLARNFPRCVALLPQQKLTGFGHTMTNVPGDPGFVAHDVAMVGEKSSHHICHIVFGTQGNLFKVKVLQRFWAKGHVCFVLTMDFLCFHTITRKPDKDILRLSWLKMVRVLSIDVGIKNLAFCLFHRPADATDFVIEQWDTVDLSQPPTAHEKSVSQELLLCNGEVVTGRGRNQTKRSCGKPALWRRASDQLMFCRKHANAQPVPIPPPDMLPQHLESHAMKKLQRMMVEHTGDCPRGSKREDLVTLLKQHSQTQFLQEVVSSTSATKRRADQVELVDIGRNLQAHFDQLFARPLHGQKIDHVIIENQISPIATRMKTIQGMIVQYCLMCGVDVGNIEFISASNKLKVVASGETGGKEKQEKQERRKGKQPEKEPEEVPPPPAKKRKYSDRKKDGVQLCQQLITSTPSFAAQLDLFLQHTKKDDLSDAFLQGIWFLRSKNHLNNSLAGKGSVAAKEVEP